MGVKLGIIGFGYMGHWHLKNAPKVEGVEVVAAYDILPERVQEAREIGLAGFDTLDEFLKSDLFNLVLVDTPNDKHCELVCAALNAGKNVICEKPVAMSLAELDKMIDTAKANNKLFTVHQNRRWDKDFRIVKEVYDSGELGHVYSIQTRLHGSRGAMFGWRAEPEHGGGMIYDWGVHFVDQLLFMMGFDCVKSVFCKTENVKTPEVEDYFMMVMDLKNGANVQMEIGTWVLKALPRWLVLGDKGTLYINDFTRNGGIISVDESVEPEEIVVMTTSGPTRTFAPRGKKEIIERELPDSPADLTEYYANLRDAIDGKAELIVKPEQVRAVFTVLEAMFKSAKTGEMVKL